MKFLYRLPQGGELPIYVWGGMLEKPWDQKRGKAYVHLIFPQDDKVWFVFNEKDQLYDRPSDWGLPTEEVIDQELIFNPKPTQSQLGTVWRLIQNELNVFNPNDCQINPEPVKVFKDKFGKYHFVFAGKLETYPGVPADVPAQIQDSAGEVTRTKLVASSDLEERNGKPYLDGAPVRPLHIAILNELKVNF